MLVRTIKVKMSPEREQSTALLEVFRHFNAACNWISQVAFAQKAFRQVPLHAACYHACRDKFGLSWQITPERLMELTTSADTGTARRAFDAMMTMHKIDIAKLDAAVSAGANA